MNDITFRWLIPPGPAPCATIGTPGPSWPQQLYAAGLIDAPTIAAAAAYMASSGTISADEVALALANSENALTGLTTKSTTYYQSDTPALPNFGDSWVNTGSSNALSVYDGTTWQPISGGGGGSALLASAATAFTGSPLIGSSGDAWQDVCTLTVGASGNPAGQALINSSLIQTYAGTGSGNIGLYGMRVLLDGTPIGEVDAGMFANELPYFPAISKAIATGSHVYTFQWRANNANMSVANATFSVLLFG